jgi:hypothetical protein
VKDQHRRILTKNLTLFTSYCNGKKEYAWFSQVSKKENQKKRKTQQEAQESKV